MPMTQIEARQLAGQLGGIATQESRLHGRWAKPDEPWIVTVGDKIVREVPGKVEGANAAILRTGYSGYEEA